MPHILTAPNNEKPFIMHEDIFESVQMKLTDVVAENATHTHTAIPIFDELHTASEPLGPGFMHSQLQTTFPFCRIIQMACPNSEKYFAIALDEQNNNNIGNKPITTPTKSKEYCVWCVCVCQRHFYNWWSLKLLANSSELSWQTHKVVESKSNIDHCVVCSHTHSYTKHTSVNSAHFLMNS